MFMKIVGLGKCGSRIVYDFHVAIRGGLTSYEIHYKNKRFKLFSEIKRQTSMLKSKFRDGWFGLLLPDEADLIVGDVDANNDVIGAVYEDAADTIFTGKILSFDWARGGGCANYHILGEQIMKYMLDNSQFSDVLLSDVGKGGPESIDIYTIAFSLGGGTGGGASTTLAETVKQKVYDTSSSKFVYILGVGILPEQGDLFRVIKEEAIQYDEEHSVGDSNLAFSAGRYLTKHYAKNVGFDGVLLVTNNILPLIEMRNRGIEARQAFGKLNFYIANLLMELSTSSTSKLPSLENPDANELKMLTGGECFCAGFAESASNEFSDICRMFIKAIRPVQTNNENNYEILEGLSITLEDDLYIQQLEEIYKKDDNYIKLLEMKSSEIELPYEFRQAIRVGVFYGVPHSKNAYESENNFIMQATRKFFPNANLRFYRYYHNRRNCCMMIWIVGLCSSEILYLKERYIFDGWKLKPDFEKAEAVQQFIEKSVAGNKKIDAEMLRNILDSELEHYNPELWSEVDTILESLKQQLNISDEDIDKAKLNIDQIAGSLDHFREIAHRTKTFIKRPSLRDILNNDKESSSEDN